MRPLRLALVTVCALMGTLAMAQQAGLESHGPAQAAADMLRDVAGADGAFIAAGQLKSGFDRDNLASLMQYPDDEIVVVSLKGAELVQAFERALSLYPQSNSSFLQVSGFEIAFDPNAPNGQRVRSASAGGSRIDDGREYRIAMPSSLGRGGFGYFRIWDKNRIVRSLGMTVEKALAGKKVVETRPRWIAQS